MAFLFCVHLYGIHLPPFRFYGIFALKINDFSAMDNKGITKRQFWIQMVSAGFNVLLGLYWIIWGITSKESYMWIFGIVFLILASVLVISLVNQLKRHRIEDPKLDEEVTRNFKEGMKGAGIVIGLLVFFFLFAFGLVALFK